MAKKTKPTTSANRAHTTPAPTAPAPTAPVAFALVREEIEAVPAAAFVRNNLDTARAARRGLAAAERIEPLLPALARLPDFDFRIVSDLRTYALAVLHTHDLATEGSEAAAAQLAVLIEEAVPLRALMLSGAELLALAGLVSKVRVAAIRSGQGYADTAGDLQALGRLYLELWAQVKDKVPVTRAMAERAITLSAELNAALGGREIEADDPLVEPRDPTHLQAQAFTLFARAYAECRRGVAFLRYHHGDAEAIVPSLYAKRRKGVAVVDEGDEDEDEGDAVVEEPMDPRGDEDAVPTGGTMAAAMTADRLAHA